jgi:nuclear pore complex protein Nup133
MGPHITSCFVSWDTIRQTRDITDAELHERFKATALYSALCEVLQKEDQLDGYHLRMPQAFPIPSLSEISSRWPGMSQDQVDAIAMDYQAEAERMAELELDDVYDRIRELAAADEFDA